MTSRRGLLAGVAVALVLVAVAWVWTLLDRPSRESAPAGVLVADDATPAKPTLAAPTPDAGVLPLDATAAVAVADGTSAAGSAIGAPALQDAVFTGRVVDADGAPIEGATVSHHPARRSRAQHGLEETIWTAEFPWSDLPATSTGADGRFVLPTGEVPAPDEPDADEPLSSPRPYDRWPQLVVQHPDHAVRPFLCEGFDAGAYDCGDIVLRPGAVLAGRVVDPDGRALPGARVRMSIFGGTWTIADYGTMRTVRTAVDGTSGDDGRFELRKMWAGKASFDVLLEGYVPGHFDAEGLTWGEVRELPDVVLMPGTGLTGFVVDEGGEPIAGAEVLARSSRLSFGHFGADTVLMELRIQARSKGAMEARTRTDEHGGFTFAGLAEDGYSVIAGADGFEPRAVRDVVPGGESLLLALVRQGTVLVTVVAKGGEERVDGVTAEARRLTGGFAGINSPLSVLHGQEALDAVGVAGDPRGMLLVQQAGTQKTELVVAAPGFASNGFVLDAVQPPEMATRTVRLAPESSLIGLVTDDRQAPLVGATVKLSAPGNLRVNLPRREVATDQDGRYRFGALRAGDWRVSAAADGHVPSEPRTVTVKPEQEVEAEDIALAVGARIVGEVIGLDGVPEPAVELYVSHHDPVLDREVTSYHDTDAEGRFDLDGLAPGEYRIEADPGADRTVTAMAGEIVEVTLVLRRRPLVRGRVTDAAGPVEGARVLFATAGSKGEWGGGEQPSYTDADGNYELEPWSAGEYAIIARHGDDYTAPVERVLAWGSTEIVDLAFRGGWAAGRVIDAADGEPLAGARLILRRMERAADGSLHETRPPVKVNTGSTDEEGRYRFDRLLPGTYQLSGYRRGYVTPSFPSIDVPDGGGVEVPDLVFGAGGSIAGRVVMADGSALPPELQVELRPLEGEGQLTYALVEPDGGYALRGVPGGTFRLVVDTQTKTYVAGKPPPVPLGERQVSLGEEEALTVDLIIEVRP